MSEVRNSELKGSRIDPAKVLSPELSGRLMAEAARIGEVKGLDDMGVESITAALFMGAAIALDTVKR